MSEIIDVFGEEVVAAVDTPLVVIEGPKGDPGVGVSPGGAAGQMLVKKSGADYDTEWRTPVDPKQIGDLADLTTEAKENLVAAINEAARSGGGGGTSITLDYITEEVEDEIACTGITLDKSVLTFNSAGQQTIIATVTPANTTDALTWTSDNPAVAAVSEGVVTAYANGSATITATCGGHSASCTVEVSGITDTVAVTGITLNQNTASVQVGDTITLTATVEPDNATNKTVTWTSDNEPVATVEDGVVTGVSEGTASIGAMTADGGFSAVCNVTVNEVVVSEYRNLFDKDTMVTANQGITGSGVIGTYAWGLARVPVKENTQYSYKPIEDNASNEPDYYEAASAGCIGFANTQGEIISRLAFGENQTQVDNETNGVNCLLKDYTHGKISEGAGIAIQWVTFTTPAGCAYLLFNTALRNNADKIQFEEGDTIHNYYLPYDGGKS